MKNGQHLEESRTGRSRKRKSWVTEPKEDICLQFDYQETQEVGEEGRTVLAWLHEVVTLEGR